MCPRHICIIHAHAYTDSLTKLPQTPHHDFPPPSHQVEANIARCPDEATAEKMIARIDEIRKTGNSVGGAFAFCVHTSFVIVVGILFFAFVRVVWGDVA